MYAVPYSQSVSTLVSLALVAPYNCSAVLTQKVSPGANDIVALQDASSGQLLRTPVAAFQSAGIGVGSIDGRTGLFTTGGGITSTAGNQLKLSFFRLCAAGEVVIGATPGARLPFTNPIFSEVGRGPDQH